MTPQEKGRELVDKYFRLDINSHKYKITIMDAKEYALIAVDEILDDGNASSPFEEYRIMYWQEVKQEIYEL